jgi:toxin ParE1/3/4
MRNKFKVYWTDTAQLDLNHIISYIAKDNINIAEKIYLKIKAKGISLESFPFRGRIIPELKQLNIIKYRELIEQRWRIIYFIQNNDVYIVSIIDTKRNFEEIILDRFLNLN